MLLIFIGEVGGNLLHSSYQPPVLTEQKPTPKPVPRKNFPRPKPRTPIATRKLSSENSTVQDCLLATITPTDLPLVPPKKSAVSKQVTTPPADVVFELENVPMPSPTTSGCSVPAKSFPIKEFSPSCHSLQSCSPDQSCFESVAESQENIGPLSFTPTLPIGNSTLSKATSTCSVGIASMVRPITTANALPPLPPKTVVDPPQQLETSSVIPLPPKDPGPPSFTPLPPHGSPEIAPSRFLESVGPFTQEKEPDFVPPPPPTRVSSLGNSPTPQETTSTVAAAGYDDFPPFPPKQAITPPITENDYPQDSPHEYFSGSETDEECPLISIQSSQSTGDNLLGLQVSSDVFEGSSSEENSPLHPPIRQQLTGLQIGANAVENELKLLVAPSVVVERDDYINQEVIDMIEEEDEDCDEVRVGQPLTVKGTGGMLTNDLELQVSNGHDYMNSDLVKKLYDDDEEEEEEHMGSERLTIRSTLPRQSETDNDYENQEVLDIIPLVTISANQAEPFNWSISQLGSDHPASASSAASSIYDTLSTSNQPLNNTTTSAHSVRKDSPLHNRDSASVTFPRTKSDAAYLREYSDSGSSVSTTPGSIDSQGMDSGFKGSTDFFDGVAHFC